MVDNRGEWLEIVMNGKSKKFRSGYKAWEWANQQSGGKLETKYDEKKGPFLSDFFKRLAETRQKKVKK